MEKVLAMTEVGYVARITEAQKVVKERGVSYPAQGTQVMAERLVAIDLENDTTEVLLRTAKEASEVLLGWSPLKTGYEVRRSIAYVADTLPDVLHYLAPIAGVDVKSEDVFFTGDGQVEAVTFGHVVNVLSLALDNLVEGSKVE